jgi:hypothetical protein
LCAGRPELFVIGPELPVQLTLPDSKPGLSITLPPVGGSGSVPPPHDSLPAGTEIALNAFSTAAHVALVAPYSSFAEAIAPLRAAW